MSDKTQEDLAVNVSNNSSCCGDDSYTGSISEVSTGEKIHSTVREYYADKAVNASSCCGDRTMNYDTNTLMNIPDDVAGFSLGCGNPISLAAIQPGETVLDLGSGGGLDCFLAAREVGEQGRVIGVDMTPEMLDKARANASKMDVKNVDFRYGFMEDLPVDDNIVDVIISNCVINLSPDKDRVFAEMFRVLKPGGRVAVSDIVSQGDVPETIAALKNAWSACAAGALPMSDFKAGLEAAGFVGVSIQPKNAAGDLLDEMPQDILFSGAITATKPK